MLYEVITQCNIKGLPAFRTTDLRFFPQTDIGDKISQLRRKGILFGKAEMRYLLIRIAFRTSPGKQFNNLDFLSGVINRQ